MFVPDSIGPVLGQDLEHEEPVHGAARPAEEGDQTTGDNIVSTSSYDTVLGILHWICIQILKFGPMWHLEFWSILKEKFENNFKEKKCIIFFNYTATQIMASEDIFSQWVSE